MKTSTWTWIAFAVMAAAQLSVPAWMIASQEIALSRGVEYRFPCAPVDPYDIFRGRYVTIQLEQMTVTVPEGASIHSGQRVHAVLAVDEDGFAFVESLQETRPADADSIPVRVMYIYENEAHINYPFDRYYMNEHLAPEAERVYAEHAFESNVTLAVRVYKGHPVVAGLYIDDQPIEEYLTNLQDEE